MFTYHIQKVVHMRPFMYKKSNGMPINSHFDGEIVWYTRLDGIPRHRIVMRVYQRFVQIENECLPLYNAEAMPGDRRQWKQIIFDWLVLNKLSVFHIR